MNKTKQELLELLFAQGLIHANNKKDVLGIPGSITNRNSPITVAAHGGAFTPFHYNIDLATRSIGLIKKSALVVFIFLLVSSGRGQTAISGHKDAYAQPKDQVTGTTLSFSSSDSSLVQSFNWARQMALHYKGHPNDPVGPWYESALPPRHAFCMRDVSHQSVGGAILGLDQENKNMLTLFVSNISEGKDWCSFWEMNREGKPAPQDYRNDTAFWYCLPANFDLISAAWRLYQWTGDSTYITDPRFLHFFDISVTTFIDRWVLQPDSLLTRPAHPNAPANFNIKKAFSRRRGLPSYSEGVRNIKIGVDLIAAIYRGMMTYGDILSHRGQKNLATIYYKKAKAYQKTIEDQWWDQRKMLYQTYYSNDLRFGKKEGETFLLWFDALRPGIRKTKTIEHLLSKKWNVENMSYHPLMLYQNGYDKKANELIRYLTAPTTKRREYPEVSFGVVEAVVQGLMGVAADAAKGRIFTLYRSTDTQTSTLEDLPVLGTIISLTHTGSNKSIITNKGNKPFVWRAAFEGRYKKGAVTISASTGINATTNATKKSSRRLHHGKDENGSKYAYVDILVQPGSRVEVLVK